MNTANIYMNMTEWHQDKQSELESLTESFMKLRSYYLKSNLFLVVVFTVSFIISLFDRENKGFLVSAVTALAIMAVLSWLFLMVGQDGKKTFFFDDDCVGYKTQSQQYKFKWEDVLAVETDRYNSERIAKLTFKARSNKTIIRPDLTVTVEKESEIYEQLMAKIESRKLPIRD